jgi:CheY-like chemotaxis protein
LSAERSGDQAVVRVRDDGIGIDGRLLPHIFDAFTQADHSIARSQGGLGLGLTLVRGLVELHGGAVSVRSEGPGKGSEFVVRLPVVEAMPGPSKPNDMDLGSEEASSASHHRVLVVDDNVPAAKILATIASTWHHDVRIAYTGPEALEVAQEYHPDVVLLDIGLPGMSGYEVAEKLRQMPEFAHVTIAAVTGYGQEEDRKRSIDAGFDEHLVKPITPELLRHVLMTAPPLATGDATAF